MGGGGGFWPKDIDPKQAEKYLKDSQDKTERAEFEQKICKMLDDYLAQFNKRDTNKIAGRLKEIKDKLQQDIEGFVDFEIRRFCSKAYLC